MKIGSNQVLGVLRNSAEFCGILIYGEDRGLVRERALAAVKGVVGGVADPFRMATLLREEHGRLGTEAGGLALGGGRRVIHVHEAGDALLTSLEKLKLRSADNLLVLEAGELSPRSKLRAYAEKQQSWATIACYMANAAAVRTEIEGFLSRAGVAVTPDALEFLTQELAGESTTRRAELEKLALYAGGDRIDLTAAELCCARSMEASLAGAVAAALGGRGSLCDALLDQLAQEGATGPGLLAVLSGQLQRLLKVRLLVDSGQSVEDACRSLTPPMYPRQIASFAEDVRRWRTPSLESLGRAVREADIACKRAASPDLAIVGRLLASVAGRAPARA